MKHAMMALGGAVLAGMLACASCGAGWAHPSGDAPETQSPASEPGEEARPPAFRLGLSFPGAQTRYYDLLDQADMDVVRLSVSWRLVEQTPGRMSWRGLDGRIAELQSLGIEPFLTLESDSPWASTRDSRGKVKNATPRNMDDWARFAAQVAERYDGDGVNDAPGLLRPVVYFQAANEWEYPPNPSGGWLGRPDELITFVNAAHDAIKAAHPEAVFVMGGLASNNLDLLVVALGLDDYPVQQRAQSGVLDIYELDEIEALVSSGIIEERIAPVLQNSRYDVLDVHLYGAPARDAARIEALKFLAAKPIFPVISAECGGPSLDYKEAYRAEDHFFEALERNLGLFALDVEYCLWFRLGEGAGGSYGNRRTALFSREGHAKPGFYAYQLLGRLIDGAVQVSDGSTATVRRFDLLKESGETVSIAWRRDHAPMDMTFWDGVGLTSEGVLATGFNADGVVFAPREALSGADSAWLVVTGLPVETLASRPADIP